MLQPESPRSEDSYALVAGILYRMTHEDAERDEQDHPEPSAFERFEQFARKLIAVPKREIDKSIRDEREQRRADSKPSR